MKGYVLDLMDQNSNVIYSEGFSKCEKDMKEFLSQRAHSLMQNPNSVSYKGTRPASFRIRKI
ncbi:MAG: hypothetical protein ACLFRE_03945 [Desulfovermiculus sp.]